MADTIMNVKTSFILVLFTVAVEACFDDSECDALEWCFGSKCELQVGYIIGMVMGIIFFTIFVSVCVCICAGIGIGAKSGNRFKRGRGRVMANNTGGTTVIQHPPTVYSGGTGFQTGGAGFQTGGAGFQPGGAAYPPPPPAYSQFAPPPPPVYNPPPGPGQAAMYPPQRTGNLTSRDQLAVRKPDAE